MGFLLVQACTVVNYEKKKKKAEGSQNPIIDIYASSYKLEFKV